MRRVPLLSGSRVVLVSAGDDDVILRPPSPPSRIVDVEAAVRDALRFPLSGAPLDGLVTPGGRATILVEPAALPLPGAPQDARQSAVAVTIAELERCGVPDERQTILVAGGLGRRFGQRDLERILSPPQARTFRGRVVVHDAEDESLVPAAGEARIHPALVDTDLVLTVTAAETVLHGGPGALIAACDAATARRAAEADSLLEAAGSPSWALGLELEAAVKAGAALAGVSLVLDLPRLTGMFRGYPDDSAQVSRLARSPLRAAFSLLPHALRRDLLGRQGRRMDATGAFAGPPSVAHAEALLRGIALRGTRLDQPVDALVVGVPWIGPHVPREPLNPVTVAAVALGLALRLRRDAFPIRPGGSLVFIHPLTRSFAHGTQAPYATMFNALRTARDPDELAEVERVAAVDERALTAYRSGAACHPLLPYADWAGCAPALSRLGRVIVAGCRDATAARTLGFVPSHGISSALEMAHGVAGGRARLGILLAPPYAPLLVG
ncbi:MAG: nickel-dependent lactate racemase [Actinomycetota bacterium]|nr:nickel-dependent lactate racemase [Actinomycetota bacterium]